MSPFKPEDETSRILAAVVEASDDAIIGADLEGVVRTWNGGAARLYGYAPDEIVGRSMAVLVPSSQGDELAVLLDRLRAGERIDHAETIRLTKDGQDVSVSRSMRSIRDASGIAVGLVSVERDLTGVRRTDVALRMSEQRWRSIIDSTVDGMIVIDERGRIEAFNRAAERLFGYAEQDVVGQNVNRLMPEPYRDEHDGYLARYLATGEHKIIGIGREVTGRRQDGTTFPLHLSVGEMASGGERRFTGILHDLTARVQMEERLREQTALARLGEMAAVIAHEVKNPLAGVRGAIQVIGGRLPAGSGDSAIVKEIIARIDTLNDLLKDLLLFARPPQPRPQPVDIGPLIVTTAEFLSGDPALSGVRVNVHGSAPPILADAGLLQIVFLNLLMNGAQAMGGRGRIEVMLEPMGRFCQITFNDAGPGIPADVRDKVFTPFFTTKARGSGLGLPTARRIIEAHGGTIGLECPPGGGTVVTIHLPTSP